MKNKQIHILALFYFTLLIFQEGICKDFYVDPVHGNDNNKGTLSNPYLTLEKALKEVALRVDSGLLSDKIYLRAGVYKKQSAKTLYQLRLKGTANNLSLISAMPCSPDSPGAVQRKSGKWYERVVFDDAQVIKTKWVKDESHPGVWKTNPGYVRHEWTHQNLWCFSRPKPGYPLSPDDSTPHTTSFTVAPYMLLQDNEPYIWMDSVSQLVTPGLHTYDHPTNTLYIHPFSGKDPNSCRIESWYGGPEYYEEGILYLDGEGRALFNGNMEYAGIVGCEFRMVTRLFELERRGYVKEEDRKIQRHVTIEDNLFEYGWTHFLLDANTIYFPDEDRIRPRFDDRMKWLVRNNVFYRPEREVFQVHGANHVFEYNEVIDHTGPWAGPAGCVGTMNSRNMKNYTVRYNYISGNGLTRYSYGNFLVMEVVGKPQSDEAGDYINGPVLIENNLITNFKAGSVFLLGKGNIRMRNVTIRNNILGSNVKDPLIVLSNPQQNLVIENNLFYNNSKILSVAGKESPLKAPPLASSIFIRNNMFVGNKSLIDVRLYDVVPGSSVVIDNNLFSNNEEEPIGTNALTIPVEFMDPANGDFRIKSGNANEIYKKGIGPYLKDGSFDEKAQWWKICQQARNALKQESYK